MTATLQFCPQTTGTVHFVGIGGIGMSGIAEMLAVLGFKVQGSDLSENYNTKRLQERGVTIFTGHDAQNVEGVAVVVVTSDAKSDNVEVARAKELNLPVMKRAEMLAELMRFKSTISVAGTHGKTTTTSLVAAVLDAADLDPTVINGGIINAYGTNARLGQGNWLVAEADESDGSFLTLPTTLAIVTNIDPEHLAHYGSFDALKKSFQTFIESVPFYGAAILCVDHPEVKKLSDNLTTRAQITYGLSDGASIQATNIRYRADGMVFDVLLKEENAIVQDVALSMFGEHNVQNALVTFAVAKKLALPLIDVREGLKKFSGVKRRFTHAGTVEGVTIIDDYGHHPVEILSVLKTARSVSKGRVVAVIQPHRYSRLHDLFNDFCTCANFADSVILTPVFSAGEQLIESATHETLRDGMIKAGHGHVMINDGGQALAPVLADLCKPGDYVICLGAGSITTWASQLPQQMADHYASVRL